MRVIQVGSGPKIAADILPMKVEDFKTIKGRKSDFREFDWDNYWGKEVYKCIEYPDGKILGLMCLAEHADPSINAMEIELLEVGTSNVGKNKKLSGIAGCLISFAARESFKRGHDGFTFLTPKTDLIKHYEKLYVMFYLPPIGLKLEGQMIINERLARKLIKQYLE